MGQVNSKKINDQMPDIPDLPEEVAKERRKPQFVSLDELQKNQEFMVVIDGQKHGPFNTGQIKEKLSTHEIKHSDAISTDYGTSWNRVGELPSFDRRKEKREQQLPCMPNQQIFADSDYLIEQSLNRDSETRERRDALVGLAQVAQIKPRHEYKDSPSSPNKEPPKEEKTKETIFHKYKNLTRLGVVAVFFVALLGFAISKAVPYFMEIVASRKIASQEDDKKKVSRSVGSITTKPNRNFQRQTPRYVRPKTTTQREGPRPQPVRRPTRFNSNTANNNQPIDRVEPYDNYDDQNYYDDKDLDESKLPFPVVSKRSPGLHRNIANTPGGNVKPEAGRDPDAEYIDENPDAAKEDLFDEEISF